MRPIYSRMVLVWIASFHSLVWASTTFAEDVATYDWLSLVFALAAGLLGGAGRTVITLVSQTTVVGNTRVLLLKDLVVALIGGGVAYLCIQGYNSFAGGITMMSLPHITRDLRVLVILAAGYSRGRWLGVVDRLASEVIDTARSKLRQGSNDVPAPPAGGQP
ncbi:hypothetical protein [Paracidovorax wautersii]|uniref:Uncharacterized protein n=1 Tax=Paracidovorax wautersii TaxID=1177982 RepID=A0A1I2FIP0_9BURK|nr:hypothetical protein [Paracidovorax wautersii]SFF05135.1 hypothetical protein SAMN04489711_1115 [Paracidovorax wautersii]